SPKVFLMILFNNTRFPSCFLCSQQTEITRVSACFHVYPTHRFLERTIYIPAAGATDDSLKLSGPSPLRNMLNFVMKRAVESSTSYIKLSGAFEEFNEKFLTESSEDGFSISNLIKDINEETNGWRTKFGIDINTIKPEEIVKNLLMHWIEDERLNNERVDIKSLGQGFQRHLIYTLIRLANKYRANAPSKKKEFKPDFQLILFEEPEAFLHPSQQENLKLSLKTLSKETQILITSHSPHFASKQIQEMTGLIKLTRPTNDTIAKQLTQKDIKELCEDNTGLYEVFCNIINDSNSSSSLKNIIKNKGLGNENPDLPQKQYLEKFKYMLYLDSERSSVFFANRTLICEGASEKIFLDLFIDENIPELRYKQIYILDAMGKFNIHRFMHLFNKLGIYHSILFDSDQDREYHSTINNFIKNKKNSYTKQIESFEQDMEHFLGIQNVGRRDEKPLNIVQNYMDRKIEQDRIDKLIDILRRCLAFE
ncbi:MAG: AAA family ATPase, partial [bacterium]|nr:AAA family ATPase [bacterium]